MKKLLTLNALVAATFSCGNQGTDSQSKGLDTFQSNIASESLALEDVENMKILPNTHVPKGILISYGGPNYRSVKEMYQIIRKINATDQLQGLEGYKQEITLLVGVRKASDFLALKAKLHQDGLLNDQELTADKIPSLQMIEQILDGFDLWMQDWGEFAAVKGKGNDDPWQYAIMDVGRGRGIRPSVLADIFDISFLKVTSKSEAGSGNYGGNLEATVDGIFYFGDRLTDLEIRDHLLSRTDEAIELHTNWLNVGHVDEFLTFIPSANNACGFAMLQASPIRAINLLLAHEAKGDLATKFPLFSEGLSKTDLALLLKDPTAAAPFVSSDFTDEPLSPVVWDKFTTPLGNLVAINIAAARIIEQNADKLEASFSCAGQNIVEIPQLFNASRRKVPNSDDFILSGAQSLFQNSANMVMLRDHLAVPLPTLSENTPVMEALQDDLMGQLSPHVGAANIHFIDVGYYHDRVGAVHCGTNVLREIDMPFNF